MTPKYVIVENVAGYEAVAPQLGQDESVVWFTSSAYLLEKLTHGGVAVRSIEDTVTQEDLNTVGWVTLELCKAWGVFFDEQPFSQELELKAGQTLLPQLRLMLVCALSKALLAQHWMTGVLDQGAQAWVVGNPSLSSVAVDFVRFAESDSLFYRILQQSSWSEGIHFVESEPESMSHKPAPIGRKAYWICRGLTVFNAEPSKWLYALWRRMREGTTLSLAGQSPKRDIYIAGNNELIKETLWPLLRQKAQLHLLHMPKHANAMGAPLGDQEAAQLEHELCVLGQKILDHHGYSGPAVHAMLQLCAQRLRLWVSHFTAEAKHLRQVFGWSHENDVRPLLLSHGLTDPKELLFYQVMRQKKLPIVEVQHGGSAGLSHAHRGIVDLAEINACQASVVYNQNFQKFYAEHLAERMPPTCISGAPSITRRDKAPKLFRQAARSILNLKGNRRVVMYLANMLYGNSLNMPYGHLDTHYAKTQKQVAVDVFGKVDAECLVKIYPPRRFQDPHPLTVCKDLPKQVRVISQYDFRYLRAASDLLILDIPYGTLGWGLAANKPTVLLDLPFNAVLPHMKPIFEAALFYVDTQQTGWVEQLQDLINMPKQKLEKQWAQKAEARRDFLERCLLGPTGDPGKRIADFVMEFEEGLNNQEAVSQLEAVHV